MKSTKLRAFLFLLVLFLSGCGLSLNQPAVGPDGTIAVFLDETGAYDFLPEGAVLTLLHDGSITQIERVNPANPAGVVDWSLDGDELLFVETEVSEWGEPNAWNLSLTDAQADSEPLTFLSSTEPILDAAFTAEGNVTYLLFDEERSGKLMLHDRIENTDTCLLGDVLSYRPAASKLSLTVIQLDENEGLPKARVSTYVPNTGEMETIASFFLTRQMEETLFVLPACFLWDMDSSGTCLALALYDQLLVEPDVDIDAPSLYLVDAIEETGKRIALLAVMPAFSPDGSLLAYIGSENEENPVVYLYNRETEQKDKVPNSDGAVTLFWIDQRTLGLTFETDVEVYQLMKILLDTGEVLPLTGS